MNNKLKNIMCFSALILTSVNVQAEPAIWDSNYGDELTGLTECDDCTDTVALGFSFPFAGNVYSTISVNSNGGIALGNDVTTDLYTDYDIYNDSYFESDFTSYGSPVLLPFSTDLDNDSNIDGLTYFKTDADIAVITWVKVSTHEDDSTPFITMQVTLDSDGVIIYGYNGITGHLIDDLDQGIVVGVSAGDGATPLGSADLSANATGSSTIYEIWCFDGSGTCFEPSQANNDAFDLDNSNLMFKPDGLGGFEAYSFGDESAAEGTAGGSMGLGALLISSILMMGAIRRRFENKQ